MEIGVGNDFQSMLIFYLRWDNGDIMLLMTLDWAMGYGRRLNLLGVIVAYCRFYLKRLFLNH